MQTNPGRGRAPLGFDVVVLFVSLSGLLLGLASSSTGCMWIPGAIAGSGGSEPAAAPSSDAGTAAVSTSASSSTASTSASSPPTPEADITAPAGMPDLAALLGPRRAGWTPTVFADLQRDMSPEDAGKVVAGADKISEFGISKVKAKGRPGVDRYEFHFLKDDKSNAYRLHSIDVLFSRTASTPQFYEYLLKVTTNKYGPADPADVQKKLVTWMGSDFAAAQVQFVVDRYRFGWTPASN